MRGAWAFAIACALAALAILVSLNILSLFLGVASLALVAAYPFMKRITWWPQAWLGLTFNWGVLLGFAAARGGPSSLNLMTLVAGAWASGYNLTVFTPGLPLAAALLYLGGVAWTLGYDTVYALQDLEDDALAGVKSSARRLGDAAPRAILAFYAMSVALAVAAGWAARLGILYLALRRPPGAPGAGRPDRRSGRGAGDLQVEHAGRRAAVRGPRRGALAALTLGDAFCRMVMGLKQPHTQIHTVNNRDILP